MWLYIIVFGILIFIWMILQATTTDNKKTEIQNNEEDYSLYTTKNYVMTPTELTFFRELKKVTDELELLIFPQVDLEKIIQVKNNNGAKRNKIKSRSIDYTIVNNKNCKIVCCIELDDKSHERESSKKIDEFKNEIFKHVEIPLYRVKVNNYYNLEELKEKISKNI